MNTLCSIHSAYINYISDAIGLYSIAKLSAVCSERSRTMSKLFVIRILENMWTHLAHLGYEKDTVLKTRRTRMTRGLRLIFIIAALSVSSRSSYRDIDKKTTIRPEPKKKKRLRIINTPF